MLLAVSQATPPVPRQTANKTTSNTQQPEDKAKTQKEIPSSPLPIEEAVSRHASAEKTEGEHRKDTEQSVTISKLPPVSVHRDWVDCISIFLTLALAIIGALGVCLAIRTLKTLEHHAGIMSKQAAATTVVAEAANATAIAVEAQNATLKETLGAIKRQADTVERQTAILQQSIDVVIDKERARISVTVEDLITQPEFIVRFEVRCYCPTLALDVQGFVEAYATDKATRMISRMTDIGIPKIVEISRVIKSSVPVNKFEGGPTREKFLTGEVSVIFHGNITYRDVFQRSNDASHKVMFRHKWTGKPSKIQGDPLGFWKIDGNPEENSET